MKDTSFAEALTYHQAGRIDEAAALYKVILAREPNHADSLHLLGLITVENADPHAGIALIRRAMAIQPGHAPHYNSLGHAYRRLGRLQDAVHAYRAAAELRPESPEIHNNLATTLHDLGCHREAIEHYRQATELAPEVAEIWYNLANALAADAAPAETELCYRTAVRLRPDFADALANYGRWLMAQGRWAEAANRLDDALHLAPMNAGAWNNLGIVSQELGRAESEACYHNALAIDPGLADAHYNMGCLLFGLGRTDEAVACHEAAIAVDPKFGAARLAACMAQLPILYRSEAEIAERRARYGAALRTLAAGDERNLAAAIGRSQPFFLPYQGEDDRALQSLYGELACRVLAERDAMPRGPPELAAPPGAGERIRVGIVCGFFCDHTLFKLFLEGWLTYLDRQRFEVIGFHTGRVTDAQTARCAHLCDHFVRKLPSAAAWEAAVADARAHVLLYPEVGIDPIAGRLAAMRLAPVQCVAWGQPETTGMPTMDYFLSSELMESPEGEACYTERLVRLPHLGLCYLPDDAAAPPNARPVAAQPDAMSIAAPPDAGTITAPLATRAIAAPRGWGSVATSPGVRAVAAPSDAKVAARPGGAAEGTDAAVSVPGEGRAPGASILRAGGAFPDRPLVSRGTETGSPVRRARSATPVFWSGQALYKYLPRYDSIFPRIAAELGDCRFVFIAFAKSQGITGAFRERLAAAFAACGLDAGRHVVILPPMAQREYLEAVAAADVILDTPEWSGGKSTLDCLACDPAIVTLPGRFMRGRHTTAILRRIGCTATIAGSIDEYVSIAVRLARDPDWREEVRRAVRLSKHLAFGDLAYVRALERFLAQAVLRPL